MRQRRFIKLYSRLTLTPEPDYERMSFDDGEAWLAGEDGDSTQHAVVQEGDAPLMAWGEEPPPPGFDGMPCLQAAAFTSSISSRYIVLNRCNHSVDATFATPSRAARHTCSRRRYSPPRLHATRTRPAACRHGAGPCPWR